MKKGDIYRWRYNEEYLRSHTHEPYWCCSMIGVVDVDESTGNSWLVDTFWYDGSSSNKIFTRIEIKEILEVTFVANFNDLEGCMPISRTCYLDDDCVDLNHPNSTRGNFYIRKGAKKSIEKMTKILKRNKYNLEQSIKSTLRSIEMLEKELINVTEDTYIYAVDDFSLADHSYVDDEIIKELK